MNEKNKDCDIIADLLPLYLEEITNPETNCFMEEHLAECENCRKNYQWMKSSFTEVFSEEKKRKKGKKAKMFKKVKWKMVMYAYVFFLVAVWLYCVTDLLFGF